MEKRKKKRGIRALLVMTVPAAAAVRVMLLAVFLTMMLGFFTKIQAQPLIITGDWSVTVPPITEAGADYVGTFENPADLTLSGSIPGSLLNLLGSDVAQITVSYTPLYWDESLELFVKREGGAASVTGVLCVGCSATIVGGLDYNRISDISDLQLFTIRFSGLLGLATGIDYNSVKVQLQLGGVSVTTPVENYSANVVFTVSGM